MLSWPAPGFAPKVIDNAETTDLTTLAVDDLVELLDRRHRYAVSPEETLSLLTRSGAFQDDRLGLLDESIQDRTNAGETPSQPFGPSNMLVGLWKRRKTSGGSS
jgi:hypothetical protein